MFREREMGVVKAFLLMGGLVACVSSADASLPVTEETQFFRNTHYYVVSEKKYEAEARTADVRSKEGALLARVSSRFKSAMDIEGTGRLMDGRVLNFSSVVDGEIRYAVSRHEWGRGVGDCPLLPFRTVAVDRNEVPLGSKVLISETRGMRLPDGTVHDGIWRAEDVGGAIKRDRVDLFVGEESGGRVLRAAGITHLKPLSIQILSDPEPNNCTQQTPSFEE
jgi:hypothetical protein